MSLTLAPTHALLDPFYAALARELATDLYPVGEVLARYGFTGPGDERWEALHRSEAFQALLGTATREWNALDSTQKRVRAKAMISVEMAIPEWHRCIVDPTTGAGLRADLAKLMVAVAGIGQPPPGSMPTEGAGFKLNIVINPSDKPQQVLTITPGPVLDARDEGVA